MENKYELNKNLKSTEKYESSFEKELSSDIVVPDYCDDINRIIRVDAKPIIKNKYFSNNSVKLNGIVAVTVLYIPEQSNQLKSFSFSNDFDYDLRVDEVEDNRELTVDMEIGELNCRLLNPRKLSVKIQNTIKVNLHINDDSEETPLIFDIDEDSDIQKLEQSSSFIVTKIGEGETKIDENITIQDEMAVSEIIYADVAIVIDDIKPIYNKAVIKFTASVKCLYTTAGEKSEYKTAVQKIPSTIIIDINDVDESFECIAKPSLCSLKTDIDTDPYGENKIINVESVLQVELKAYKNNEKSIVIDAYSPKFENTSQNVNITMQKFKSIQHEKFEIEDSIILDDLSIKNVNDVAGVVIINEINVNNSILTITSNAEMSVIVQNEEGEIQNLDCSIPIKNDINMHEIMTDVICEGNASIIEMSAIIESSKLTVKITVLYECVIIQNEKHQIIKTLSIDTEKTKSAKKDVQMILYYPAVGETVWNIAKKYNTSMEKISKYNKCDGNRINDKKIIVIPV